MKSYFHYSYLLILRIVNLKLSWHLQKFKRESIKIKSSKKILCLPAYPEDWPGAVERMSNWKRMFNQDEIEYDVEWPCSQADYLYYLRDTQERSKFKFNLRKLFTRYRSLKRVIEYDVVYIQRESIPLYDSRYVGIEKTLIQHHPNIVYDFYDADYESTPIVTNFIFNNARKITVASQFLENRAKQYCENVLFTRLSLPIPKDQANTSGEKLVVGWMGSPGNSKNLLLLADVFKKLGEQIPSLRFEFVCREFLDLGCEKVVWIDINDPEFNYSGWLKTVDIGIVPYFEFGEKTKAKTAMKSLEFWANSAALICSPYGMSDKISHLKNCIIASNLKEWEFQITNVATDGELRAQLSEAGLDCVKKYHSYQENFQALKDFLLKDPESSLKV